MTPKRSGGGRGDGDGERHVLLLVAHGSLEHPGAAEAVRDAADALRGKLGVDAVRAAFWKQRPTIAGAARRVAADRVTAVPLFTSDGYFADRVVPRELDAGRAANPRDPALRVTDPVGTHPSYTDALRDAAAAAYDGDRDDADLVVVGHGTERSATSGAATRWHADRLVGDGWRDVHVAYLDEPPHVEDLHDRLDDAEGDRGDVVILPFFVAPGVHVEEDVPAVLGIPEEFRGTFVAAGRRVHYADPAGVRAAAREAIRERAGVDERPAGAEPAGRAVPPTAATRFRRAVADGAVDVWGELALRPCDGGVELRHVDDLDEPAVALDDVADVRGLERRIARDDDGAYRPQAGERSLPTGWRLVAPLDRVADAVDAVYPGTVADASRPTATEDLPAVASRQTGIYDGLDALDDGGREVVAETVCGACSLARCWTVDGGGDREPPEDAEAPCTAPCPLALEVARAVADGDVAVGGGAAPPTRDELTGTARAPVDADGSPYRAALVREEVPAP